jgi:hypothetical protein
MCGAANVPDMSTPHWRIRQSVLPDLLFKEGLIYEQSARRTLREQQERRPCVGCRQQLKIEQLYRGAVRSIAPMAPSPSIA